MSEALHIISLGFGVQSSTLHKMAERGAFKVKPVASIFANTKQEPRSVYKWQEEMKAVTSIPIIEVTQGDLAEASLVIKRSAKTGRLWMKGLIPAYLKAEDGTKGLMGRKCTSDFKIIPIQRQLRAMVGVGKMKAWRKQHKTALNALTEWKEAVKESRKNSTSSPMRPQWAWDECQQDALMVQWIGISTDEADRMKESRLPWLRSEFPLIDKGISRDGCKATLCSMGFTAPRSACKFCPFHSDDEWMRLNRDEPKEFEDSVAYERKLQHAATNQEALKGMPFLHESCKTLDKVDFNGQVPEHRQVDLFTNECEGLCGV